MVAIESEQVMNLFKRVERKIEMNLIEKLVAGFIERTFKNYITTIVGVLSVILYSINTFGSLIPTQYSGYVNAAAVVIMGVALILAKDVGMPTNEIPVLGKIGVILLLLLIPMAGAAQTTTTQLTQTLITADVPVTQPATSQAPTATFTGGSDVIALHYNGAWGTGNLTTESFDLMDFGKTKSQHLFIEGKELIGTQAGINAYTGGVKFQPDLSKVLAKTNVSPANFGVYFSGSGGVGTLATGGSHIAVMVGGGLEYRSSSALSWNPVQIQYVRIGNQNAAVISTGLSFLFGQK